MAATITTAGITGMITSAIIGHGRFFTRRQYITLTHHQRRTTWHRVNRTAFATTCIATFRTDAFSGACGHDAIKIRRQPFSSSITNLDIADTRHKGVISLKTSVSMGIFDAKTLAGR
jgi:hypothetical protein